jgi:hypothetical protein
MTLADFAIITVEVFSPYILFWCLLFLVTCTLLAIFIGLVLLVMSRISR